jgi:hypothetical protein
MKHFHLILLSVVTRFTFAQRSAVIDVSKLPWPSARACLILSSQFETVQFPTPFEEFVPRDIVEQGLQVSSIGVGSTGAFPYPRPQPCMPIPLQSKA